MKRWMAWAAAAALGCSCVCLSACGFVGGPVNNDGTISGNYRPATDIEILQVVNSIRQDKVLGDVTADEWNFGLEYATDRLISLRTGEANWKEKANAFYRLVLEREAQEDEVQMRGSGYGNTVLTAPAGVFADGQVQLMTDDSVCNDALYSYSDELVRWQGFADAADEQNRERELLSAQDFAASANAVFGLPLRLMTEIVDVAKGGEADGALLAGMTWEDALLLREQLEAYGVSLEVDLSSGVKLHLSASEETVRFVLASVIAESVGAADADIEALAEELPVRFVQCAYDIYFAVDSNGVFAGVGVRADIEAVIEGVSYDIATGLPAEEEDPAQELRLTIRGMERLSAYGGNVALPDDLESYPEPGAEEQPVPDEQPEEVPELPGEEGAEEETEEAVLVPPTQGEFRAAFGDAFGTLWEQIYAKVLQAEQEPVQDAADRMQSEEVLA